MKVYNLTIIEATDSEKALIINGLKNLNQAQVTAGKQRKVAEMIKTLQNDTSPYTMMEVDPDGLDKIMNKLEKGESL